MNDGDYFSKIEDSFIGRGKPRLLSPAEWALIEQWEGKGIPVEVVVRGIERAFDSHKGQRRRINSLAYCTPHVEREFTEMGESEHLTGKA